MNRFTLVRLPTLAEASRRVAADPGARVFRAAGIDLLDRMKERLDAPDQLVELRAVSGAHGTRMRDLQTSADRATYVGALQTLAQIADAEALQTDHRALAMAAASAATPLIRNAATLGGNLLQRPRCWYFRHADLVCLKKGGVECLALTGDNRYNAILGGGPSFIVHPSSLATALAVLDASVEIADANGQRTLPVADLFALPTVDPKREHTLHEGEVLLGVRLPPSVAGRRSVYDAVKEKQSHDWPLAEAAVCLTFSEGRMNDVRVALGHVAPIPWRAREAEAMLEGQAPTESLFARAATSALASARPMKGNAYKVPLASGLLRQVLHAATDLPLPE